MKYRGMLTCTRENMEDLTRRANEVPRPARMGKALAWAKQARLPCQALQDRLDCWVAGYDLDPATWGYILPPPE